MNNRQQAREEALFVLLMEQVARQQDRQARQLGRALEEDPEAALSPALQQRCMQTLRRGFRRQHRHGQTYEPVVNWLPVGLTLEEQRSDCGFSNYHYTDSDGCWLDVELLLFSSGGVMSLDTENADVRETVISGYPAITIHKEGVSVAACTLEDLNAILLVTGQGFSVDDVVRVAESVRLQ